MTPTISTTGCAPACSRSTISPTCRSLGDILREIARGASAARARPARARARAPADHPHDRGRDRARAAARLARSRRRRPTTSATPGGRSSASRRRWRRPTGAIKGFLYPRMYRHRRIMRIMGEAEDVVRDLFGRYVADPGRPAAGMARRASSRRRRRPRAADRRLHRRHDRPLRDGRARAAVWTRRRSCVRPAAVPQLHPLALIRP